MKIYYITNARIPSKKAHGIQVMKMCEAFAQCGHKVTLVIPNRRLSIEDNVFVYYGVLPIFSIKKVWTIDTARFGKLGFRFQQLIFSTSALFYVLSEKFDLIYSRDELSLFFISFFAKKFAWESHMARYSLVAAHILKSGAQLVVISNGLKEFYLSKGLLDEQILVAHDAINLEEFDINVDRNEARRQLGLSADKKIAMYVGYLKDWKGYNTLLKASEYLKDTAQIAIIGGAEKQISTLQESYPDVIFWDSDHIAICLFTKEQLTFW
jgi:glycosyltransferase involved in cell wall biosynthesis